MEFINRHFTPTTTPKMYDNPPLTTSPAEPVEGNLERSLVTRWLPVAAELKAALGGGSIPVPTAHDFAVIMYLAQDPQGFEYRHLLERGQHAANYLVSSGWLCAVGGHEATATIEASAPDVIITTGNDGQYCNALAQARQWARWPQASETLETVLARRYPHAHPLQLKAVAAFAIANPEAPATDLDPLVLGRFAQAMLAAFLHLAKPKPLPFAPGGLVNLATAGPEYVLQRSRIMYDGPILVSRPSRDDWQRAADMKPEDAARLETMLNNLGAGLPKGATVRAALDGQYDGPPERDTFDGGGCGETRI